MPNSFLKNYVLGNDLEEQLPRSRREQFNYIIAKHKFNLIKISLLSFLFFLPYILLSIIFNYSKVMDLSALDNTSNNYVELFQYIVLKYKIIQSNLSFILFPMAFIGLSGVYQIVMDMITGRLYQSIWVSYRKGLKNNWISFGVFGFVFALSLSTLSLGYSYLPTIVDGVLKYVLYSIVFLQFLIIGIWLFYAMNLSTLYNQTSKELIRNSFIIGISHFPLTLAFLLIYALPIFLIILIPSPFHLILLFLLAFIYFGLLVLSQGIYGMALFDQLIQPMLGETYIRMGLRK